MKNSNRFVFLVSALLLVCSGNSAFGIRHSASNVAFGIRHSASNVAFGIRHSASNVALGIRHSAFPTSGHLPDEVKDFSDTVIAWHHMNVLAADSMRGRYTPSLELEKSAQYIAQTFEACGVEPLDGSFMKSYGFDRLDVMPSTELTLTRNGVATQFVIKSDFNPHEISGEGTLVDKRVVFVGYGITAPDLKYDDYEGMDVKGAVVVVIRGEPTVTDSTKPFGGDRQTAYASNTSKLENAKKHGAVAMLVADAARGTRKMLLLGARWPSLFPDIPSEFQPIALPSTTKNIPCVHIGELPAIVLFGSRQAYAEKVALIDSLVVPQSCELPGIQFSGTVEISRVREEVNNVVGIIRGAHSNDGDANSNGEYVVVGAHYDHVGVGKPVAGDSIFNGADDNASGTTGLLLIAKALSMSAEKPVRDIVLVAFSGEERGLLGSKAYVANSPLPIENCVAMLNMDMIGRCTDNNLSIGGEGYCPDLTKINAEENATLEHPLTLKYDIERYFFRSDQANFARKKIPVLFYFTGEHKDYHKVTDDVSLIKMRDMMSIVQLVTRTAWRAANLPRTKYVMKGWED